MNKASEVGKAARQKKGWWLAYRFLLLRRFSQLLVFACFLSGPVFGVWILKGNLSSSLLLDSVPFTDPFVFAQSLFAGIVANQQALIGVAIVTLFYLLVGGRVFCAWVCPFNLITDLAAWLRRKLNLKKNQTISRRWRYWLLVAVMISAVVTGSLAWELINPVSALHRGILFGIGLSWFVFLVVFLMDLLAIEHGWCGHFCPMGAFYSLLNRFSIFKVDARFRERCDNCMDCFHVCPEPDILKGPVHGQKKGLTSLVKDISCTNCGRCVDVCAKDVFVIGSLLTHKQSLAKVER